MIFLPMKEVVDVDAVDVIVQHQVIIVFANPNDGGFLVSIKSSNKLFFTLHTENLAVELPGTVWGAFCDRNLGLLAAGALDIIHS